MLHVRLNINQFRQSQSTTNFKDHYRIVNEFAKISGERVLKLGRGYFDWEFFVRPREVEKQLERDVKQLQGYLSPLGEMDSRQILLAYESNFGKYAVENVAFSSGVLTTFGKLSGIIRTTGSEELLIATPNYPQLEESAIRHGPVKLVAARKEKGYNLTAEEVEKNLSRETAGVVLLNPNVVGVYQDAAELGRIIALLEKNNVFLVLDETNDTVQWRTGGIAVGESGRPRVLRSHYPENIDSTAVIRQRSFSKGDMLAEYRIGYVVAMPEVIAALEQSVGANTPPSSATEAVKWIITAHSRWAAESKGAPQPGMVDAERKYVEELKTNSAYMDAVRAYVSGEIAKLNGAEIIAPQNGFNVFFRIEGFSGWKLFEKLLYDCKFAVNPGSAFGFKDSDGWVRLTLANGPDKMEQAMEKLHRDFPSAASHERFGFAGIEKMRTWEGSGIRLSDFLPKSERII